MSQNNNALRVTFSYFETPKYVNAGNILSLQIQFSKLLAVFELAVLDEIVKLISMYVIRVSRWKIFCN